MAHMLVIAVYIKEAGERAYGKIFLVEMAGIRFKMGNKCK